MEQKVYIERLPINFLQYITAVIINNKTNTMVIYIKKC